MSRLIVILGLIALAALWLLRIVSCPPLTASAEDAQVLPRATSVLVPTPAVPFIESYDAKGDVVHYRCSIVAGFTVMEPTDCPECQSPAFACTNCECKEEK